MAAILIILTGFTSLAEGTFIKLYNSKYKNGGFVFTAMVSLFSMLFFVFTDKNSLCFTREIVPYGLVSGILYCSASFLTYEALSCGSFALSMLILSYSGIFSILYGIIILHEEVSLFATLGFLLMIISLYLTRAAKNKEDKSGFSLKWLICIAASAVASGMFGVVMRIQQIAFDNAQTNQYMIITLGFSAIVLFFAGLAKSRTDSLSVIRRGFFHASAAGLSNGATNFLALVINTLMPISLSTPIRAGVKIILSFFVSAVIFRESFLKRQTVGVMLGAAALVLLNM